MLGWCAGGKGAFFQFLYWYVVCFHCMLGLVMTYDVAMEVSLIFLSGSLEYLAWILGHSFVCCVPIGLMSDSWVF